MRKNPKPLKKKYSHFSFYGGNAADPVYTLYVSGLNIGDEIAVFDDEKIVGTSCIISENVFENSVPIFSTLTNETGYKVNNPILIKVWDSQTQSEVLANYIIDKNIKGSYTKTTFPETDGEFSVINVLKGNFGTEKIANPVFSIYPNPASEVLNIVSN